MEWTWYACFASGAHIRKATRQSADISGFLELILIERKKSKTKKFEKEN